MSQALNALKSLLDAEDAIDRAHDVESWSEYPKCGLYPLEQIKAIEAAQKLWFAARKEGREIVKNFS